MRRAALGLLAAASLAAIVAYGTALRLEDPLSSPVMGAEDPYTHVVFTKESLEKGAFGDSFHLGTGMYPPGLHALLGALVPLAGLDFYQAARFAPVVFGALAIAGIYVLAARLAGRVRRDEEGREHVELHHAAGLAAALVTAVMPEHVFRTNLLFPTGLDLALLPAFLLAFVLAAEAARDEGRLVPRGAQAWGAIALFVLFAVPLVFAHPWVVPLFLAPAALFAGLRVFREARDPAHATRALATPAALAVAATAFAMAFRWDESDTGFADFFGHLPGLAWMGDLDLPGLLLFPLLLGLLGLLAVPAVLLAARTGRLRARLGAPARAGAALLLAAGLLALLPWLTRELPQDVSYVHMLGRPAIVLALAGLVVALVRPTPLGDLALCVSLLLFPLTAVNVFDSPFWPQRTVAYLCIGVALLAACALAGAHDLARRILTRRSERAIAAPALLAASVFFLAGAVAAAPATTYPWYRLYDEAQFQGFQDTVALLAEDPSARVVVHGWQPGLMVKTLGDPAQVWYSPDFFNDPAKRAKVLAGIEGPAYVLVDKYLLRAAQKGEYDLRFLQGEKVVLESADGRFRLHLLEDSE